jgi:hypothetical protein
MRNFCVWAIDLAILLTGMRNIIFPTDGKRNPRLPDPTRPTRRTARAVLIRSLSSC